MNSSWRYLAVAALVVTAACSGGGDSGGTTVTSAAIGTTSTAAASATSEPAPSTTAAGPQLVPAGVNWTASTVTPAPPAAAASFTFEQVTATAGVPPAPAGYPFRQSDYISAVHEVGGVLLATGSCGCWEGGNSTGVFGGLRAPIYLFRSADTGATWSQVDLSVALGDVNGSIIDVVEHEGQLVLAATVTDAGELSFTDRFVVPRSRADDSIEVALGLIAEGSTLRAGAGRMAEPMMRSMLNCQARVRICRCCCSPTRP